MSKLLVRLAIRTNQPDSEGFVYSKDSSRLGDEELVWLLAGRIANWPGGYVFVVDGQIWNSRDHAAFNPDHIRFSVDTLVFSPLLLEDLAAQIGTASTFLCALTEMSSLQADVVDANEVIIRGISEEQLVYPAAHVLIQELIQELVSATDAFLQRLATRSASNQVNVRDRERETVARENRAFVDRWRLAADTLRRLDLHDASDRRE